MDHSAQAARGHDPSLIDMLGRVHQGIRREMRARLAPWGLSVAQYTTLSALDAQPQLSNAQLARLALVAPQSMFEILAQLEGRGLVRRQVDPDHARILRTTLSDSGQAMLAAAAPAIEALADEVLAGVPAGRRRATIAAMRTAMANLSADPTPARGRAQLDA